MLVALYVGIVSLTHHFGHFAFLFVMQSMLIDCSRITSSTGPILGAWLIGLRSPKHQATPLKTSGA